MVNKLKLTRNQLATFLKDHEQIKQFEQLFTVADNSASLTELESVLVMTMQAQASADSAMAHSIILSQESALRALIADQKAALSLSILGAMPERITTAKGQFIYG